MFLPAPLMILSVAVSMLLFEQHDVKENVRLEVEKGLERWFWISVLQDRYGSSTNTRALGDARGFRKWISEGETPEMLKKVTGSSDLADEVRAELINPDGGEQSIEAGVLCLVAANGGRDWAAKRAGFAANAEVIERHHIFPSKGFPAKQWNGLNALANLTPQSRESNSDLGNDMPVEHQLLPQDTEPHFARPEELAVDGQAEFDEFLARRGNKIADAMIRRAYPGSA